MQWGSALLLLVCAIARCSSVAVVGNETALLSMSTFELQTAMRKVCRGAA